MGASGYCVVALLFNIYGNEVAKVSLCRHIFQFATGTAIFYAHKHCENAANKIEGDIITL